MSSQPKKRILVAGIGNIFLGDDAFGVEVARELGRRSLPEEVSVVDFGIRGYDLAYAIAENPDLVVLVDAVPRGQPPGTVYLIELDAEELKGLSQAPVDAHSLDPVHVLQMALSFGGRPGRLYLVGCEPAVLDEEEGFLGLSESVQLAVPQAAARVESLIHEFL
jgi:hydrogenase maturation protease